MASISRYRMEEEPKAFWSIDYLNMSDPGDGQIPLSAAIEYCTDQHQSILTTGQMW